MSAYRLWGAIVAGGAVILLAVVVYLSFGPEETVVPETAVNAQDGAGGASEALQQRTVLQRWRETSSDTPEGAGQDAEVTAPLRFSERGAVENPLEFPTSWWQERPADGVVRVSENVQGLTSVPYPEAGTFEQPGGRTWRRTHNDQIRYGGGWLLFGMIAALGLFLAFRGRVPLAEGYSGERIERFNAMERANHWMTATSFIVMALTGLVIIYGKPLLLPLIGLDAMGAVALWSAWLHMAFAVPFVLGISIMIVVWLAQNLPDRYDWPWLKRFGGFLDDSADNPPAGRFNTGQKIVFWSVVLGGLALLVSGLALMFPFYWFGYDGMQWAQSVHAVIALLMIALIFGHIYIGTAGMEDAFEAMWSGKVDRNWLKEHHSAWYEEEVTAQRGRDGGRGGSAPKRQQPAE